MSRSVESLRQFFAAINRNDMDAVIKDFAPDIVRVEPDVFPAVGTYRGIAEVQEHIKRGRATWAEGSCEPEAFFEKDDKVVVYVHVRVRLNDSIEWIDARIADGFTFRNGSIVHYRSFVQRADAMKWADIQE
jgi:ketosteroid isomerase-like protein